MSVGRMRSQSRFDSFLALTHPIIVSIAPILLLAAANIDHVHIDLIGLPILCSLIVMSTAAGFWGVVLRDLNSAALLTSLTMSILLSHGHVHSIIWQPSITHLSRYIHALLVAAWFVILISTWFVIRTNRRDLRSVTQFVWCVSALLVCMAIGQLWTGLGRVSLSPKSVFSPERLVSTIDSVASAEQLPDIYYIILDEYGRQDKLESCYGYDNSKFIHYLKNRGFFVADDSHSNYALTQLSLASSLNLRFITEDARQANGNDATPMYELISRNELAQFLKARGYQIIHLNTGWTGTARSKVADVAYPFTLTEFHRVFLETTPLKPVIARFPIHSSEPQIHLFHFAKLKEISQLASPTFTFSHIICPHPPYCFDREGNIKTDTDESPQNRDGYIDQLVFLNRQLREIVDSILATSAQRPIIILQSDHGTASLATDSSPSPEFIRERMSILNAYFVPQACRERLYDSITPVNSFRLILSTLFGDELPRLDDRSFFSWYATEHDFADVTETLESDVAPSLKDKPLTAESS